MGFRGPVSRTTLAKANERRDWRIHADFAQSLIRTARDLHADDRIGVDLGNAVYALDSTTIDLCLGLPFTPRFEDSPRSSWYRRQPETTLCHPPPAFPRLYPPCDARVVAQDSARHVCQRMEA